MPRFVLFAVLVVGSLFAGTACGGASSAHRPHRIGVIPKGTSHAFWRAVERGVMRADREFDDIEVVWKAPMGEGDTTQQIALFETFMADGYDGMCLAPLDSLALVGSVRTALARKTPVLIFDSPLADDTLPIVSTVATDNHRGGRTAGAELARLLNGEGRVIVLRYMVGSFSTHQREQGCLEELARHPGIHVISQDIHAGPDEASAIVAAERLLTNLGAGTQGVFCSNESTLSGFLTVLQRDPRGFAGKIRVVGFDASSRITKALESGLLDATVVQDPVRMGYLAITTMRDRLNGKETTARIETGETLVTRDMLNDPAVRALLDPLDSGS
ncbi:MAG: substrate-binding domain-containing protein [Planctomycetes bacterium]|nr:substrate-binding domain-containing protein [Planctomycetota bacterium]